MGYTGIVVMMALESSFIPFPSEVVVPPAGYLASQGHMDISLVIVSGIAGSVIGALANYFIAVFMGRALLLRYGRYIFLPEKRLDTVEHFFRTHGEMTTFAGRLIPGVRQYISFPAGLAKMSIPRFVFFTSLGSGVWVVVLAFVGYAVGTNMALIRSNLKLITLITMVVLAVVIALYVVWYRKKRRKRDAAS